MEQVFIKTFRILSIRERVVYLVLFIEDQIQLQE